jgi:hypothetical protein
VLNRRLRRWQESQENDPLAGLINLFDLWMVFSVALLISLLSYLKLPTTSMGGLVAKPADSSAAAAKLESFAAKAKPLERFRVSHDELRGEGQRLGTAYRLTSGEVVYVPDGDGR